LQRAFDGLPSEGLFNLPFHMCRDLWNAKLRGAPCQGAALKKGLQEVEHKLDQLRDRIIDVTSGAFIAAYEKQIKEHETQKALMRERVEKLRQAAQELWRDLSNRLRLPRKPL
jgi:uncharacterized protein involved in exopolysaccharide biosynthesis